VHFDPAVKTGETHTIALVQCGTPHPAELPPHTVVVEVPIRRLATVNESIYGALADLDMVEKLVGVPNTEAVTVTAVKARIASGGIVGLYGYAHSSIEDILALAPRVATITLLIVGLMLGYLAVGLISVLLHFVDETQARAFTIWNDASFAGATPQQLMLLVPAVAIGLFATAAMMKPLNALLLGERYAESLGIDVTWIKRGALLLVAWLSGVVTAFCGPVAFLGLVAAQLARGLFFSSDHRIIVPGAALLGAALGLAADWVTHMPWSQHVFHLNAVIGLVGAPVALWVLLRSKAMRGFES
jgi:iron complex transport system permease protein